MGMSEFDFIDWIRARASPREDVVIPPGDDLAAVRWSDDLLLVGADQVLDGVHFDSSRHAPRDIGRKAVNRNLSDCAAMACLPVAAVVTAALPTGMPMAFAKELYLGMKEAGERFGCAIVGGDTAAWAGRLALGVSILGRPDGIPPVRRSGARAGDLICVTGPLGGSIGGRHMTFEPRVALARELARRLELTAMIDLSDGLSRDLRHVCRESGVGAIVDAARLPIHDDVRAVQRPGWSAADHAAHDGEDYELLFTTPARDDAAVRGLDVYPIGRITAEREVAWDTARGREALEPRGWEHRL